MQTLLQQLISVWLFYNPLEVVGIPFITPFTNLYPSDLPTLVSPLAFYNIMLSFLSWTIHSSPRFLTNYPLSVVIWIKMYIFRA